LSTVTAAANRIVTEPIIAAATYVEPRPSPAPLDYVGVIYSTLTGIIEQITDSNTLSVLSEARDKLIVGSNGERNMVIVEKSVAAVLKIGMPSSAILDVMESMQQRGYELLLGRRPPPLVLAFGGVTLALAMPAIINHIAAYPLLMLH